MIDSATPSSSPLRSILIGVVTACVVGGILVNSEFGREIDALRDRPTFDESLADEPFFPAPSPDAAGLAAASRKILTSWADEADALREAEVAAKAARAAGEEVPELPRDQAVFGEEFASQDALENSGTWVLSLYLQGTRKNRANDDAFDKRGPFMSPLSGGLEESVRRIWSRIPTQFKTRAAIDGGRIKVDQLIGSERSFPYDGGHRGVSLDEGLDGIVLRHADEEPFYFLPSLAMERKVNRRKLHARARYYARVLAGWKRSHTKEADFAAFRTRAWVETAPGGGSMTPLKRGNADVPEASAELLRERIKLSADYLTRDTSEAGEINYEYFASDDRTGSGYNILRHAGTVYSMMQAYRLDPDPELLAASLRAKDFFKRAMQEDKKHPGEWFVRDVNRVRRGGVQKLGRRAKLGGIGLGLCMMVEIEKAVPGTVDMDLVRGMARHVQRMQNPDGSFESFYNWDGRETSKRKSIYYSGEAILGLLRLHQLTGEEEWLDTAVRGADYLVHKRWKSLGIRIYVPMDAWLLQALEEMDRVRPDKARMDYAFAVGESIARGKLMDPEVTPVDFLGANLSGPSSMPNAATAGAFGEALTAAARLEARRRPGETRFLTFAMHNANFQLRNQFWGPNSYYLPNPARALGGFRVKQDFAEVRNDHVQHNLSGLFGLLDILDPEAPDIGEMVAGAQNLEGGVR